MKKFWVFIGLLAIAAQAGAAPVIYSFSGVINRVQGSMAAGYQAGDTFTYNFMLDLDQPGYYISATGEHFFADSESYDYFFADIQQTLMTSDENRREFHFGNLYEDWLTTIKAASLTNNSDVYVYLRDSSDIHTWQIGDTFTADEYGDTYSDRNKISSSLTLVSITESDQYPPMSTVPVPGAAILAGFGTILVGRLRHRKML